MSNEKREVAKRAIKQPKLLPEVVITLPNEEDLKSEERTTQEVKALVKNCVGQFQELADEQMSVKAYHGGITNTLYCVINTNNPTDKVLVRIFGSGTDQLIDRNTEFFVIKVLNSLFFAPPLYSIFSNGCVYGHIDGKSLEPEQLKEPQFQKLIAHKISEWHTKIQMTPHFPKTAGIWPTLDKWLVTYTAQSANDPSIPAQVEHLTQEVNKTKIFLTRSTKPHNSGMDVVWCHNDLLSGNIIYSAEYEDVNFIDYEYCSYNYRAFDIANHFCEWMGFDMKAEDYPDEGTRRAWIKEYVAGTGGEGGEVQRLLEEVEEWKVASHLFWGIWACIQTEVSENKDFDYQAYAKKRLGHYEHLKQEFNKKS
eukprot:TRINITY_DN2491_c2_g1_i1.p1 TRINITY_DN2491_c2_g1~~TRINITY_DN2491_c2_g1_i1.p1  ORF type:complete len:366 (-),score=72.54 TRINITY_DN2491_c2_g1_i1:69-1166(-)